MIPIPPSPLSSKETFTAAFPEWIAIINLVALASTHRQATGLGLVPAVLVEIAEQDPVHCLLSNVHL
jgi:hypothetical protein